MKRRLLHDALRMAFSKHSSHPMYGIGFTIFSFTVMENKILEMGMNDSAWPVPKHWGYSKRKKGYGNFQECIHSEIKAYSKSKGLICGNPFEIINVRLKDSGTIGLSAPCSCCVEWLGANNCSKVYFSTESGWAKMTLDNP